VNISPIVWERLREFALWMCCDCACFVDDEYYMVRNSLWKRHAEDASMLCVGCLENRMGRRLRPADFTDCALNQAALGKLTSMFKGRKWSLRLRRRMGADATG
jgi:hypothetical protein